MTPTRGGCSKSILFASNRAEDFTGKLYTVSLEGGHARQHRGHDGFVYFVSNREGGGLTNLWGVSEKGGAAEQVTTFKSGDVRWPAMGADGKVPTRRSAVRRVRGCFGPKVVLQNWRSASNAEMFPAGFHARGLGKVIRTPTAGAVIGTGSYSLVDGSTVRTRRRVPLGQDADEHGEPRRRAGHPRRQHTGGQSRGPRSPAGGRRAGAAQRQRTTTNSAAR